MKLEISADYLSHARKSFLQESELGSFVDACSRPLRKSIRVNTLKISLTAFKTLCEKYQIRLIPIPWCQQGFWVENIKPSRCVESIGNWLEHLQGLFYIQEASSMLPPVALLNNYLNSDVEKHVPVKILDLAAAPGSKTTQIAALVKNTGLILANEMSASRVKVLHANLVRSGVANVCMTQFDGRKLGDRLAGVFDFVLLDAPCGGEGTVRKDPSALKNWQLEKVNEIAKLQKQLILTGYQCLKPGGRLIYSTCTLSLEENHQVAESLLQETDAQVSDLGRLFSGASKAVTAEGYLHVLPQIYDSEGFFVAAFDKPKTATEISYLDRDDSSRLNSPFTSASRKTIQQLDKYYSSHFGIKIAELDCLIKQREKEIWLFPNGFVQISELVRLNRSGVKLCDIYPNKLRTTHEFVFAYDKQFKNQVVEISIDQAEDFYKGRNIELTADQNVNLLNGEIILVHDQQMIGVAGLMKGKAKNQLPRDLVRDSIRFI